MNTKLRTLLTTTTILGTAFIFTYIIISRSTSTMSFENLILLSESKLNTLDIANMNLLCAQNLNGSENLNIEESLMLLDQWAELVKQNEQKYSPGFFQNRGKYDGSYAKFQAVNLGLTLKEDLKCGYNLELVDSGAMKDLQSIRFFENSEDLFLNGFITKRKGSCSSLPVLMVAIGRRCHYPLYLVACKGHLFCRWDDGHERFNIETACPRVDIKPDDYYKQWPYTASETEIRTEKYLKNLTPKEELGLFCDLRGINLQANRRFTEALAAYYEAKKAFPESGYIKTSIFDCKRHINSPQQTLEEI